MTSCALRKLAVNAAGDGFTLDGKPWFWLGDTCWSAFTNIELADWDYYLARRAEQGINLLQINTLPQWDRCRPDLGIYPYASEDGTVFDWDTVNPAYWERARTMLASTVAHGIRPALVLSWCNFVPGTWGSKIGELTGASTMPVEKMREHVRRVVAELGEFDPVYVVSGDTDFKTPEAVDYYEQVLAEICDVAPDALRCMHINRGNRSIPEQFVDRLDFYMYQPGHNWQHQDETWKLPQDFLANYPQKPLVNSEPCYEQMGSSGHFYHRFNAQDCRASAWGGVCSGAVAGITYGAAGVWNWQTSSSRGSALGEGFDSPFRWHECLQFEGVWDFGLVPQVLRGLGCLADDKGVGLVAAQELLADEREAIRVARTSERVVAYMPFATKLRLQGLGVVDAAAVSAVAYDLDRKRVAHLGVSSGAEEDSLVVAQHPFEHDALVVVSL